MPNIEPETGLLPDYSDYLHVAVAVIENDHNEILIARRRSHQHQGGLWEFPGGKVESGETVFSAIQRELLEELGIDMQATHPLIRIPFSYPDRKVLLDVWRVTSFAGNPRGMEGQDVRWVDKFEMDSYEFPAANRPIVTAAQLPSEYLVTPEPGQRATWDNFLHELECALQNGVRLVQFRAPNLETKTFMELAHRVVDCCHEYDARVLLNTTPEMLASSNADGVHLNSRRLMALTGRPDLEDKLVSASCHSLSEVRQAEKIGADFVVLSPVSPTASHPGSDTLGWEKFHGLSEQCTLPVYALGGMRREELPDARRYGAQGVAAIRSLWGS